MGWTVAVVIGVFAVIILGVALFFRSKMKVSIKAPLGTGLDLEASNDQPTRPRGVQVDEAEAGGSIDAADRTGEGALVRRSKAGKDITATAEAPGTQSKKR